MKPTADLRRWISPGLVVDQVVMDDGHDLHHQGVAGPRDFRDFGLAGRLGEPSWFRARKKRPHRLWHWMLLTAVVAVLFWVLKRDLALLAGILSAGFLFLVMSPYPLLWLVVEMAMSAVWSAFALIELSDVSADFMILLLLLLVGLILWLSWGIRTWVRWERPRTRPVWVSLLLLPVATAFLIIVIPTGIAFHLRFVLSEPRFEPPRRNSAWLRHTLCAAASSRVVSCKANSGTRGLCFLDLRGGIYRSGGIGLHSAKSTDRLGIFVDAHSRTVVEV